MPSVKDRPNGLKQKVYKNTKGNILLKVNSTAYQSYINLRSDDKSIMDSLLYLMGNNTNHLILLGDTLEALVEQCGYSKGTIRATIPRLTRLHLISKGTLPGEYIINPLFAIKGNECEIWKFLQTIEYKGEIPSEVAINCSDITLNFSH